MSYAFTTLWHDRQRYAPGVLAVGFSALLIALQCGLLLGLFSITSIPVDCTHADFWVGSPEVLSVDTGRPIPESYLYHVLNTPGVKSAEPFMLGFAYWNKPDGGFELCMVIGSRLSKDSMGALDVLTPELRVKLTEPGTIIIDESELERLGVKGVGDVAEIGGHHVRIVDLVKGKKSLAAPYIICSMETARQNLRMLPDQCTYVLGKCETGVDPAKVVAKLRRFPKLSAFTTNEFSVRTRMHWLTKTKAGIALGFAALLGLLVGAVVTSQTLYAATAASLREYAVLQALGIPRWRMALSVLGQSFWIGVLGVVIALPTVYALKWAADSAGAKIELRWWLLISAIGVTITMALISGVAALRSLRMVEPATLLR